MNRNRIGVIVDGTRLDLYENQAIVLKRSVKDARDISRVFTDYTNEFTVPASKTNNKAFKHAFRRDSSEFDTRGFYNCTIELNGEEFSKGYVEMIGGTFKSGDSNSYSIRYFGNLLTLFRIIGDTKLSDREVRGEFSIYNFPQDDQVFYDLITTGPDDTLDTTDTAWADYSTAAKAAVAGNVRCFLTNDTDKAWKFYSSTNADDYSTSTFSENETNVAYTSYTTATDATDEEKEKGRGIGVNGIVVSRLKASIKEKKVLEAIEDAFSAQQLQFSRGEDSNGYPTADEDAVVSGKEHFFGSEEFDNTWVLFYNKQLGGSVGTRTLYFENDWDQGEVYDDNKIAWHCDFGIGGFGNVYAPISPYFINNNKFSDYYVEFDLQSSNNTDPWSLNVWFDGEIVKTYEQVGDLEVNEATTLTDSNGDTQDVLGDLIVDGSDVNRNTIVCGNLTFEVYSETSTSVSGTVKIHKVWKYPVFAGHRYRTGTFENSVDDVDTDGSNYTIDWNIPDIAIRDYLSGLQKTYNLIFTVEKDASNNDIIVAKDYDSFYEDGTTIDLTKYTDTQEYEATKPEYYTEVAFEYDKSGTFLTEEFDEAQPRAYGDLRWDTVLDNEFLVPSAKYNVSNPFEQILLNNPGDSSETGTDKNDPVLTYAWLVDNSYEATEIGLFRHYGAKKAIGDSGDKLLFKSQANQAIGDGASNANLMSKYRYDSSDDLVQTLLYNTSEADEFTLENTNQDDPSLFNTYWKGLIEDLYRKQAKIYRYKLRLTRGLMTKIGLDDTILISDNPYRINSFESNLFTGETMMELVSLNDPNPAISFKESYNAGFAVNSIKITSFGASGGKYHEAGDDVDFTVTAEGGNSELTYEWYKNDVLVSGETSDEYTLTNVADGDQVYVKVSDSSFSRTSGTITIETPAGTLTSITVDDSSPDAQAGDVTLTVSGDNTTEYTLNVQQINPQGWISDDDFDSTTGTISGGSNTHTLSIPKNLDTDTRSVVVRVQNDGLPSDVHTVTITQDANADPIVTLTASDTTPLLNETVNFTTTFTDPESDTVTYQWFVDDVEQTGETSSTFDYTQSDEGSHTIKVTITDEADNTDSDSVDVEWIDNTTLTVNFTDNTGVGASLSSSAQFSSTGTPGSTWTSFSRVVTLTSGYVFTGSAVTVTESSSNLSYQITGTGSTRTITFSGNHPQSADETTTVTINATTQQDLPDLNVTNNGETSWRIQRPSSGTAVSGTWSYNGTACGGTTQNGTWSMSSSSTSTYVSTSSSGNTQPSCGSSACTLTFSASASGYDGDSASYSISAAQPNTFSPSLTVNSCTCQGGASNFSQHGPATLTWISGCIGNPGNFQYQNCNNTGYPSSTQTATAWSGTVTDDNGTPGGREVGTASCTHTSGSSYNCSVSCSVLCNSGSGYDSSSQSCPY